MSNLKKGDFVLVKYDGELLTSKILKVNTDDTVEVEICLSARRGEDIILDNVVVPVTDLQRLTIKTAE